MQNQVLSYLVVFTQFVCLGYIIVTGPLLVSTWWLLSLEVLAMIIGFWSIQAMTLKNLHVFPDVNPKSVLVTHGPYRFIRHPMYSALLLWTLGLVLETFSLWRMMAWLLLGINLVVKLTYEERLLIKHYEEYTTYMHQTYRLIPYVF